MIAGSIVLPLRAAQSSTDQKAIPPCSKPPDDAAHYPDNMVRPKYPKDALRRGTEGKVELHAVIASDGKVKDLAVLSGNSEFSQNAIAAIRKWRFHPELRQGQPVEATYKIHVRFNPMLQEANSDVELESPLQDPLRVSLPAKAHSEDLGDSVHEISEPGVVSPKQIYSPEPEFSEKARKASEQGTVTVSLVVGTDGLPRNLQIACSSAPDLNDNAIEAVKRWKFAPGTKDGKPVMTQIGVEVSFKLHNH